MSRGTSSAGGGGTGGGASITATGFVGRYQVLERIAEGGMGSLYLARDPAIERLVAIKVLRRGIDTEELRERFAREARAAGRLRHPNIVTVFDVGEHEGDPFIAMEFLAGETVAVLIRERARLPLTRRLKLIEELCDGLAYAHRAGVVHRDVKPANLMVDAEGTLKILDFGIVRFGESGMTQAGVLVGTINYMSPEQVLGTPVDHRSDIFAVGLVAYELLTYKQAFPGTLAQGLFNRILNVAAEPLAALAPSLDPEVIAIVEQAMKREPADRYQDLARMRNDLARTRLRLEREEERAAEAAAESAGETIVYPVTPPPGTGIDGDAPTVLSAAELAEAERALASGEYRVALTLAGRSAAVNPQDPSASGILERAHAGLLERARERETGRLVLESRSRTGTSPGTQTTTVANRVGIAVAALALVIAIAAVGLLLRERSRQAATVATESTAPAPTAQQTPVVPPAPRAEPPAPPPASTSSSTPTDTKPEDPAPRRQAEGRGGTEPAKPSQARPRVREEPAPQRSTPPAPAAVPPPTESAPSGPPVPVRAGVDVPVPRRVHTVDPVYPDAARESRVQGTVGIELTIAPDGTVSDARVTQPLAPLVDAAALTAARQWQFAPTFVDGRPVPVIHTVTVTITAPERVAPPRTSPVKPPPAPPTTSAPAPAPPASRPVDNAAAIRDVLRRYQSAWQSLDADALRRVQSLSDAEARRIQQTMASADSYQVEMDVEDLTVAGDGRRASARARVTRRFNPRVGQSEAQTVTNTFELEKRGDSWIITRIR